MDYKKTVENILGKIGGKENVSYATFCATRLRLTLKDRGLIQDEGVKEIEGIVGTKFVGAQYQIIIGPDVENVYKVFCELTGLTQNQGIQENLDEELNKPKERLTVKKVVDSVLDVVGACITPMLPILTASAMMKLIVMILGANMLNLLPETNDFMRLLAFVGDAGFYFYPFFVAYGAAKKFGCSIPMALFMAGILLSPTLVEIVALGEPFTVYGIPMTGVNYAISFIPMILIAWLMSYVERVLNKWIPASIKSVFVPVLETLIMLPFALCILGPIGTLLGEGIADGIVVLHNVLGPVTLGIIGALFPLLIVTGMHHAMIAIALGYIGTVGYDASILAGANACTYAMIAIAAAYVLKTKNANERSYGLSSLFMLAVGGISEPTLFGIVLKHKKAILEMMAGGFAGGFYMGLMNAKMYVTSTGNILINLAYSGDMHSLIHATIGGALALVVSFVLAMIFGFESKKKTAE